MNETNIEDRGSRIEDRRSKIALCASDAILDPRSSILDPRSSRPERLHKNIEAVAKSPQNHSILPKLFVQVTQNGADKTKLRSWNRNECERLIKIAITYGTQVRIWGSR